MKKQLLGTAMGVALFGSAQAGFQAPPDIGSSVNLVFVPPWIAMTAIPSSRPSSTCPSRMGRSAGFHRHT